MTKKPRMKVDRAKSLISWEYSHKSTTAPCDERWMPSRLWVSKFIADLQEIFAGRISKVLHSAETSKGGRCRNERFSLRRQTFRYQASFHGSVREPQETAEVSGRIGVAVFIMTWCRFGTSNLLIADREAAGKTPTSQIGVEPRQWIMYTLREAPGLRPRLRATTERSRSSAPEPQP